MKKTGYIREALLLVAFVTTILLVVSCGYNQNQQQDNMDVAEEQNDERFDNNEQENDAQFLANAAELNLKQIQLGQLAQQKGSTSHVKELGKMMEDAHTKSLNDLKALASKKSITLPTSPTDDVRDAYKDLNEESGSDFDKAYADLMVNKHEEAIETFEEATTDRNDTDIKNWAIATLPELRKHLNNSIECKEKCDDELRVQNK